MGSREDLRLFADALIDSYEIQVKIVDSLMEQTYDVLRGYQIEVNDMVYRLRDNLAKTQSLRKRDFDRMMEEVVDQWKSHAHSAERMFRTFREQERETIGHLRSLMVSVPSEGLVKVREIRTDLLKRQKDREREIARALRRLQIIQEEFRASLINLLSKGENIRMKDFKTMLKVLKARQAERDEQIIGMIDELHRVRERIQIQWHAVAGSEQVPGSWEQV